MKIWISIFSVHYVKIFIGTQPHLFHGVLSTAAFVLTELNSCDERLGVPVMPKILFGSSQKNLWALKWWLKLHDHDKKSLDSQKDFKLSIISHNFLK